MNFMKFVTEFATVFAVAIVTIALVTLLGYRVGHVESVVDCSISTHSETKGEWLQ